MKMREKKSSKHPVTKAESSGFPTNSSPGSTMMEIACSDLNKLRFSRNVPNAQQLREQCGFAELVLRADACLRTHEDGLRQFIECLKALLNSAQEHLPEPEIKEIVNKVEDIARQYGRVYSSVGNAKKSGVNGVVQPFRIVAPARCFAVFGLNCGWMPC